MRNRVILLLSIILMLSNISCTKKDKREKTIRKAIPVSVYTVKERTFLLSDERDGEILPYDRVYLVPTVQGTLIEMRKKIGDRVKKGEVVAIVDHRVIDNQLNSLKNQIDVVKAKRILLEKDVKRFKKLYEKDAISKHRYEEVETEYNATLSQEKALESNYQSLKERVKDYFVKSPINGVITDKLYDTGNVVAGKPIYIIDNLSKVKIQTTVGEKLFESINDKSYLLITIPALKKQIKAPIERKSASVDYLTRSGKLETTIDNKDYSIKPGMYIKVKVVAAKYNALSITKDSLNKLPATGVYYVFKVNKDNTVSKVNLKLGNIDGNYQEVLEGLSAGDKVVVRGQGILKAGYKVKIVEEEK